MKYMFGYIEGPLEHGKPTVPSQSRIDSWNVFLNTSKVKCTFAEDKFGLFYLNMNRVKKLGKSIFLSIYFLCCN
jgi:hypothetical protein